MALWDYQAEDDDEITFDPGEIITDIEQIDEVRYIATHRSMTWRTFIFSLVWYGFSSFLIKSISH